MKFQQYITSLYENDKNIEFRRIDEAGLSRVFNTLKGDIDFGIISAFRRYNDAEDRLYNLKENQKRNNQLLKDIRQILGDTKAFGSFRFIGHWKECSISLPKGKKISDCESLGGKITNTLEETWCILNDKKDPHFFEALTQVAKKYNQDCFVYKGNGKFGLFSKFDDMISTLQITNQKFIQTIESMGHNIPEQLKDAIVCSNTEVVKSIEDLAEKVKTLKEGSDSGFVESAKDIEKMKNRINFLYAAFAIVVMQLVAVLLKV